MKSGSLFFSILFIFLTPSTVLAKSPDKFLIQKSLNALGFDAGTPDGIIGSGTRTAIRKFQESNGFDPTGKLDIRQKFFLLGSALDKNSISYLDIARIEGDITPVTNNVYLPLCLPRYDGYNSEDYLCGIFKNDNWIVDPKYMDAWVYEDNTVVTKNSEGYFVFDEHGKNRKTFKYINFHGKYGAASDFNDYYGAVDKFGEWKLKPSYHNLHSLGSGLFSYKDKEGGKNGIININGDVILKPQYDSIGGFYNGYAKIYDDKIGFINTDGALISEIVFDHAYDFGTSGMAPVKIGEKWGVIDTTGEWILEPTFDDVTSGTSSPYISLRKDWKWGVIKDKSGKWVLEPNLSYIGEFSSQVAVARNDKNLFGYIDISGKWLVKPQFKELPTRIYGEVGHFDKKENEERYYGLIKRDGSVLLEAKFDTINTHQNNFHRLTYGRMAVDNKGRDLGVFGEVYLTDEGKYFPAFARDNYVKFLKVCRGFMLDAETWTHERNWLTKPNLLREWIACLPHIRAWVKSGDKHALYYNYFLDNKNGQEWGRWLLAAADAGNPRAQTNLAISYDFGRTDHNIEKDKQKALYWYLQAAHNGEPTAQYNLGVKYGEGDSVPKNIKEAYYWTNQSIINGKGDPNFSRMKDAKRNKRLLAQWLTGGQQRSYKPATLLDLWNKSQSFARGNYRSKNDANTNNSGGAEWRQYSCTIFCKKGNLTTKISAPSARQASVISGGQLGWETGQMCLRAGLGLKTSQYGDCRP